MECHQPDNVFEYVQHQLFLQCRWFDKGPLDNPKYLDSQWYASCCTAKWARTAKQ